MNTLVLDGPPALEAHIAELRDVLEADVALAYGVRDTGDRLGLRFLCGAGRIDVARVRKELAEWLRGFGGKSGWAAYNPVYPEREQRNRVYAPGKATRSATPVGRALYPRFKLQSHHELRVLICDGPRLLAWVGTFHADAIAPWQRRALKALIDPIRKRLIAERRLEHASVADAALEVLLESTASAAFILGEAGAIEPGNGLARAELRDDRTATLAALRAAVRERKDTALYTVRPIDAGGDERWYLAIARASRAPLHRAKAAAATSRFGLSVRQSEVLELLLQGATSAAMASSLGIRASTVEKHLAALFERVGVANRYALIARVTAL